MIITPLGMARNGPVYAGIPSGLGIRVYATAISEHRGRRSLKSSDMEEIPKSMAVLDRGSTCSSWNFCGERLAVGSLDGSVSIFDSPYPSSYSFSCSSKFKVVEAGILKIVWVPPEYGDAVACICDDGSLSIWEEVAEACQSIQWKHCKSFKSISFKALDVQFGVSCDSLKMVTAYSDGNVKVYELQDPLELNTWQIQAEFPNYIDSMSTVGKALCSSASISWKPERLESQASSFVLGFNSTTPQLNSPKVWEFDAAHNRWLPVAELASQIDKDDEIYSLAWASNSGRMYELIAVASRKGIGIWHLGSIPDVDGRLLVEKVADLPGHGDEVWEMEWDLSGMTLATTGNDGRIRLWQSNLNGVWLEQAALEPRS